MDHQLFEAIFVLALIGQQLATAAPLSENKQHHHHHQQQRHLVVDSPTKDSGHTAHHQPDHLGTAATVQQIDDILRELDMKTTVLIADEHKVTEIYPERQELSRDAPHTPHTPHTPHAPHTQETPQTLPQSEAGEQQTTIVRRSGRRRTRRTAALLLHATLRMCDLRPLHCNHIMLQRDNVRVSFRLVDE